MRQVKELYRRVLVIQASKSVPPRQAGPGIALLRKVREGLRFVDVCNSRRCDSDGAVRPSTLVYLGRKALEESMTRVPVEYHRRR